MRAAVRRRTCAAALRARVGDDSAVDIVDQGVPSLSIDLAAVPKSVPVAIARAGEFAVCNGARPEIAAGISHAVGEAVGAAVRRADPIEPGTVRVMLDIEGGDLEFVVSDEVRGVEVWMRFQLDG